MDPSWWLALTALVALIIVLVADRLSTRRARRGAQVPHGRIGPTPPGPLPQPRVREIWWARVPYEDQPGTRDQPCVVLSQRGDWVRVAKVTSRRPRTPRPAVLRLPAGAVDGERVLPSYLEADELRDLPIWDFRQRCGEVPEQLWKKVRQVSG